MQTIATRLDGPLVVKPVVHGDERGFFMETYRQSLYAKLGIGEEFVQDNHSRSRQGVVRGMHFQPGQAKLVRCARGEILDVLVDIRPGSPTFGQWEGYTIGAMGGEQVYCPDGFAHGFCVLSELADVVYKVSTYYDPSTESGFRYDDPDVGIAWPEIELRPSQRDATAPSLAELGLESVR
jgi:dTDP-4-dehydrorhamnose 3,5-epimerase